MGCFVLFFCRFFFCNSIDMLKKDLLVTLELSLETHTVSTENEMSHVYLQGGKKDHHN